MKINKTGLLLTILTFLSLTTKVSAETRYSCGDFIQSSEVPAESVCDCESGWNDLNYEYRKIQCCGWVMADDINGTNKCFDNPDQSTPSDEITTGLTNETFDSLNPLKIGGSNVADDLSTPGGIVSRVLNFLFPLAGLILFALISWGGFEMLISATDQKGMEAGKNRVTAAIVGFILLFSSYWLAQIIEYVFKIKIL